MLEKELQVFIDGKFYPKSQARVSVFDYGLLYGDGIFEGIRAYEGSVFKLREHIDRLYKSAHMIMLQIPIAKEDMVQKTLETLRENGLEDAYIRLVVTRGVGDSGLKPKEMSETDDNHNRRHHFVTHGWCQRDRYRSHDFMGEERPGRCNFARDQVAKLLE